MNTICTTGTGQHKTNITTCICCQATYCLSCSWGCPDCHFGEYVDRRETPRITLDTVDGDDLD